MTVASQEANAIGQPDRPETKRLARAGYCLAASDLLWIPQAGLIAWLIGSVLVISEGSEETHSFDRWFSGPFMAVAGIVVIAFVRLYLQNYVSDLTRVTSRRIKERARTELLNAAIDRSPAASFPASGAFAAHVTDQVDLLGPYYRNYSPQLMRLKIVPVVIVSVTAYFSWLAAVILLVSGPLIPLFMALIGTKAKTASAARQEELTRLSGTLLDRIKGLETLRIFGALEQTKQDIRDAGERFRIGTMRVLKIAFLSSTVLELFSALGIAFCAVYVGFSLLGDIEIGTWRSPLNFTAGLFVLLLAPEFFAPLRAFAVAYHDRAAGLAAQEKLGVLLKEIRPEEEPGAKFRVSANKSVPGKSEPRFSTPPSIMFDNVSLTLAEQQIFKRVNLEIGSGETVLLKGESGCGKTTFLDCILGFHVPDEGEVAISGTPVHEIALSWRQNTIWLGQSPRLFHGSLRSNLLKGNDFGNPIADHDIWNALRLAGADELVRRLPLGLSTPLGEDGFGLSVGEIRRIALARAAMRQGAPLLLADEPTAGLDEETAADVIEGLRVLSAGRTAVIATHDPALHALAGRQIDMQELGTNVTREVAE